MSLGRCSACSWHIRIGSLAPSVRFGQRFLLPDAFHERPRRCGPGAPTGPGPPCAARGGSVFRRGEEATARGCPGDFRSSKPARRAPVTKGRRPGLRLRWGAGDATTLGRMERGHMRNSGAVRVLDFRADRANSCPRGG